MLVLTRKKGQRIEIDCGGGMEITITILEVNGRRCRVGIEALETAQILRGELVDNDKAQDA